jgi:hypothetical protein
VAPIVCAKCDLDVVAAQGVAVRKLYIMGIESPAITGMLIVLDDDFAIEVVHTFSGAKFRVSWIRRKE